MKVLRPSKNKITQKYSERHPAYDWSGRGDKNVYSSFYGKIVQSKNSETKHWINKGKLTTRDYGNYCKIKGEVDGETFYQLCAHLAPGTVLPKGTEVKRGQVVAQIGHTGNSTAPHLHVEYRDANNKNFPVEFVNEKKEPKKDMQSKEQIIIDAYKAITGEYPTDDEKKARLQKNENTLELIEDLLKGDGRSKARWLEIWNVKEVKDETAENYKITLEEIREILRPVGIKMGDDTEVVKAKISELVARIKEVKEEKPKPKIESNLEHMGDIKLWNLIIRILVEKGVVKDGKKES